MKTILVCLSVCAAILAPGFISAETLEGPCPLSCDSIAKDGALCHQWKIGTTCYASVQEDSTSCDKKKQKDGKKGKAQNKKKNANKKGGEKKAKNKGAKKPKKVAANNAKKRNAKKKNEARNDKRSGEVSSAPCPYSCDSNGISKDDCRDWKEGDTCFIEDLR